jgi:hypothetical protein
VSGGGVGGVVVVVVRVVAVGRVVVVGGVPDAWFPPFPPFPPFPLVSLFPLVATERELEAPQPTATIGKPTHITVRIKAALRFVVLPIIAPLSGRSPRGCSPSEEYGGSIRGTQPRQRRGDSPRDDHHQSLTNDFDTMPVDHEDPKRPQP